MESLERTFVTEGGIKERMHAARTGYRWQQDQRLADLERAVPALQQQLVQAQAEAAEWKAKYEDLKQRRRKVNRESFLYFCIFVFLFF